MSANNVAAMDAFVIKLGLFSTLFIAVVGIAVAVAIAVAVIVFMTVAATGIIVPVFSLGVIL